MAVAFIGVGLLFRPNLLGLSVGAAIGLFGLPLISYVFDFSPSSKPRLIASIIGAWIFMCVPVCFKNLIQSTFDIFHPRMTQEVYSGLAFATLASPLLAGFALNLASVLQLRGFRVSAIRLALYLSVPNIVIGTIYSLFAASSVAIGLIATVNAKKVPLRQPASRICDAQTLASEVFRNYDGDPVRPIRILSGELRIVPGPQTINTPTQVETATLVLLSGTQFTSGQATGVRENIFTAFRGSLVNDYEASLLEAYLVANTHSTYLIVAGHSLGGMVGERLLQQIAQKGKHKFALLVTFGSPAVGDEQSEDGMAIRRFTAAYDYIPRLPALHGVQKRYITVGGDDAYFYDPRGFPQTISAHLSYPYIADLANYDVRGEARTPDAFDIACFVAKRQLSCEVPRLDPVYRAPVNTCVRTT